MTDNTKARAMADRYRIYCYANPKEWDVTIREVADALGLDMHRVRALCQHAGWTKRFRSAKLDDFASDSHNWGARAEGNRVAVAVASGYMNVDDTY